MSDTKPFSITIFLPGGDPDGLRTIEKSGWSGRGIVFPRSLFGVAKSRQELARTGVYVLVGPPEEMGLPRVYIGEGDPIRPRLELHANAKDFWATCVAFVSNGTSLNKADVQHLEARLVEVAGAARRCTLDNKTTPQRPTLSEADTASVETFLAEMLLCMPLLGLGVFSQPDAGGSDDFVLKGLKIEARGRESPQGFIVCAGSHAVATDVPSLQPHIRELRVALVKNGVLKRSEAGFVFAQDYVFSSPSTAAGVVLGHSSNGRTNWKTADGRTLREVQEAEVAK
jgi:hypothetical protein